MARRQWFAADAGRLVSRLRHNDWGSIPLDSFPFADRLAIAEEIDTRWQDLLQPMQSQRADCWGIETMMLLRETLIKYHRKP